MPRLFIASTSDALAPHRQVTSQIAREMGWEVTSSSFETSSPEHWLRPTAEREIEASDLMLAILGWQFDPVPQMHQGGDGLRSRLQWELRHAFRISKPLLVLMASQEGSGFDQETDPDARARLEDLRGELTPVAFFFEDEPASDDRLPLFRATLKNALQLQERSQESIHLLDTPKVPLQDPVLPPDTSDSTLVFNDDQQPPGSWQPITEKTPLLSDTELQEEPHWMEGRYSPSSASLPTPGFHLRTWSTPELPDHPYPLLLPYMHPELFAGRDTELAEVHRLLKLPILVLGLHAPSGAGKSSLLSAGLIPQLRNAGQPVAYIRNPNEPGLLRRLLGELYRSDHEFRVGQDELDASAFTRRLAEVAQHAAAPPILILDSFEEMLRPSKQTRQTRAFLGTLLAATAQRQPGLSGPPCRWLLAYRREFHGDLVLFLRDVLSDASTQDWAGIETLPHDLSGPDRFHSWPVPLFGSPGASREHFDTAPDAFLAAIRTPLRLQDSAGRKIYPWRIADDGAERLAQAFAKARSTHPNAPLVPELQVVLARLLDRAVVAPGEETSTLNIEVPENLDRLIGEALEDHLRCALDSLFPPTPTNTFSLERTRVLLLLRELAGEKDERNFLPLSRMKEVLGHQSEELINQLCGPAIRLLIHEQRQGEWGCLLSHDQTAAAIQRVVASEEQHARLTLDTELLELRRLVVLSTELLLRGKVRQATAISRRQYRLIAEHAGALLWSEDHRTWWRACRERRYQDRRRLLAGSLIALLALLLLTFGTWSLTDQWARKQALIDQIVTGAPAASMHAFDLLAEDPRIDPDTLRDRLLQQEDPLWMLEAGLDGIEAARRPEAVLRTVDIALPVLEDERIDLEKAIARMVWALDFYPARDPDPTLVERAQVARVQILAELRQLYPPPNLLKEDWIEIPAGSFQMGSVPRPKLDFTEFYDERPQHTVTLSPFKLLAHEVTNKEYRRLVPDHSGADDLPAAQVSWYAAYTYAAWLGGRLPTEAEWEYAARAACKPEYCGRDGQEIPLPSLGWYRRNAFDLDALVAVTQPVAQLEPNPWQLFDMRGNVNEWVADWYGKYSADPKTDPRGPMVGSQRVYRGGDIWDFGGRLRAANRAGERPDAQHDYLGFRIALPHVPLEPTR